ncbi:MAG: hypothetical protein ACXVMS_15705 [Flavisolibacter sp.]
MKSFLAFLALSVSFSAAAQHYYQDIMGTRETAETLKTYRANKVLKVVLTSFDENNTRNEDFYVTQEFSPATKTLRTVTRSDMDHESVLTSYLDASGAVVKTVDSSNIVTTTTEYTYNGAGQLTSTTSFSADSTKKTTQSEQHLWQYQNGKIAGMLRIKNHQDTSIVHFKLDEAGNVIEERETRKGINADPVYYYYDASNRLTDIVHYNNKARRLLPEYMFSYSPEGRIIQRITVPANNDNYLIWRFQYNDQGLKTKEVIYNKQKQLTGKIEYQYSFGS